MIREHCHLQTQRNTTIGLSKRRAAAEQAFGMLYCEKNHNNKWMKAIPDECKQQQQHCLQDFVNNAVPFTCGKCRDAQISYIVCVVSELKIEWIDWIRYVWRVLGQLSDRRHTAVTTIIRIPCCAYSQFLISSRMRASFFFFSCIFYVCCLCINKTPLGLGHETNGTQLCGTWKYKHALLPLLRQHTMTNIFIMAHIYVVDVLYCRHREISVKMLDLWAQ